MKIPPMEDQFFHFDGRTNTTNLIVDF